ncbi:hypothetical protein Mp_3g01960 [Marchantia polymorpha subsp. ruderalis]|uniref:Uncharacterized protein n=2 Tax=Marchantia polymorpha TaxID=3197 RepID=A0AAF6AWG8_MARPO|nr:hypothetical protein MARPO_0007s0186 [Marchantia polymorpha]BBN04102.1 hypothetical protein Mp_3g01960 [Marchantia polymorpha subsp. ruderalis]|eukprot:PTQ47790.1 hypothetical protein MARPO_0007s0186 [Marchantia polymorpha]
MDRGCPLRKSIRIMASPLGCTICQQEGRSLEVPTTDRSNSEAWVESATHSACVCGQRCLGEQALVPLALSVPFALVAHVPLLLLTTTEIINTCTFFELSDARASGSAEDSARRFLHRIEDIVFESTKTMFSGTR